MGNKTIGEPQRGIKTIPQGHQRKTTKPTLCCTHSARRNTTEKRLRYGLPSVEGAKGDPPIVSIRNFRCAIDEPKDSKKEKLAPTRKGFFGERIEQDESTPSLMNMDEEDDDDDTIPFDENLLDCVGSLTSLETDEMVKAFDLYMEQHHHHDRDPNTPRPDSLVVMNSNSSNDDSHPSLDATGNEKDSIQTPEAPWSLKKWLRCRSTSGSVDGIHGNNGFEPDFDTLDGLRKELFEEEW